MHRNKYDLKIISIMEMSQKMEIRMAPISPMVNTTIDKKKEYIGDSTSEVRYIQ